MLVADVRTTIDRRAQAKLTGSTCCAAVGAERDPPDADGSGADL